MHKRRLEIKLEGGPLSRLAKRLIAVHLLFETGQDILNPVVGLPAPEDGELGADQGAIVLVDAGEVDAGFEDHVGRAGGVVGAAVDQKGVESVLGGGHVRSEDGRVPVR